MTTNDQSIIAKMNKTPPQTFRRRDIRQVEKPNVDPVQDELQQATSLLEKIKSKLGALGK